MEASDCAGARVWGGRRAPMARGAFVRDAVERKGVFAGIGGRAGQGGGLVIYLHICMLRNFVSGQAGRQVDGQVDWLGIPNAGRDCSW